MNNSNSNGVVVGFLLIVFGIIAVLGLMFGVPVYRVWAANYTGRAILVKAEQTRQVLVTQANAELEAAKARAQAIAIVGEAAQKYPEYRQQEFMGAFAEALREGNMSQIIYVPTEANIPVMEAGRRTTVDAKPSP
jgi:hypothetical protein